MVSLWFLHYLGLLLVKENLFLVWGEGLISAEFLTFDPTGNLNQENQC
jgi:hypothetical protein